MSIKSVSLAILKDKDSKKKDYHRIKYTAGFMYDRRSHSTSRKVISKRGFKELLELADLTHDDTWKWPSIAESLLRTRYYEWAKEILHKWNESNFKGNKHRTLKSKIDSIGQQSYTKYTLTDVQELLTKNHYPNQHKVKKDD